MSVYISKSLLCGIFIQSQHYGLGIKEGASIFLLGVLSLVPQPQSWEEFLFSQIMIEAGRETTCVPITWEHSFLESNTILGNLNFISDFLGPRERIRIQESKHAPSEMESKFLTAGGGGCLHFTQKSSKEQESTLMIYHTQRVCEI